MRIVSRTLMRRSYNRGDWENARKYAMKIIDDPREEKLAKSVVLRSYWNQKDMLKLQVFLDKWSDVDFEDLRKKMKKPKLMEIASPNLEKIWNPEKLESNFSQEGNIL